jgi:hypothetical protein
MGYTDRFYDDPKRRLAQTSGSIFGKGFNPDDPLATPTPAPTPRPNSTPVQVASMGSLSGILQPSTAPSVNAASRVAPTNNSRTTGLQLNLLPSGPIGVPGSTQTATTPSAVPQMTHTEFALDVAKRNQAAMSPQTTQPETSVSSGSQAQSGAYQDFQSPDFYNKRGDYTGPNLAARGDSLRSATAYRPTLDTATLPGQGALDVGTPGVPLMAQKGIVNPFTGQTKYQPLNQPSPYQGPGQYQVQQAATDFYRQRQQDQSTGYGTAYQKPEEQ